MAQEEADTVDRQAPADAVASAATPRGENTQATGTGSLFTPSPSVAAEPLSPPPTGQLPESQVRSDSREAGVPALEEGSVPTAGTRIHHYELIRQLGSGGMGTVFLARDIRLGRRVAIKFLHTSNPEITRRFILEARATARCSHENIVVIYEVGEFDGSPFMVLEYLQGQPLNKCVGGKRLPPARAVELMVPVVRALVCAHGQGIVHRDLKPENILVTDSGTIKVLDFGIAKVLQAPEGSPEHSSVVRLPQASGAGVLPGALNVGEGLVDLTRSGSLLGTLSYMSPEQWRGGSDVDHRTDIWAVGIMLFRMLAGKHPLDPLRGSQLSITGALDEPMPLLRAVAPDVPPGLAEVVDRCLLKHKEQRFPDAGALLSALEPFLPGHHPPKLLIDQSPYAGLSSFQEADADRFFGRSREIAALVARVRDEPFVAVVGHSGAGKSSLVRAGLVPALKRSGEAWEALVIRPGGNPLAALASIVAPLISSSSSLVDDVRAQEEFKERMRAEPGYVGAVLRSRARRERRKILLFVDQFEELYTQVQEASDRRVFTACLAGVADDATSPIRIVVSLRSDFLDSISEDEHFMAKLGQGVFPLATPSREALRDALVQPVELAGYRFETPALLEGMLQHVEATPGAWPLLQLTAPLLWEQRDATRKLLTEQSHAAMGGMAGVLARHADRILAEVPFKARALARALFLRLVTPERTRATVPMEELRELSRDTTELQRLTDLFVQARLLVVRTEETAAEATVELVHESLIHNWPTLYRWLDEGQGDAAFLEQLRSAARQWQAQQRDGELLWRGPLVEEAQRFQRRYHGELPQTQRAFLEAVFTLAARTQRRKRLLAVGTTVILALAVTFSAVALVMRREPRQEPVERVLVTVEAAPPASAEVLRNQAEAPGAGQPLPEVRLKAQEAPPDEAKGREASVGTDAKVQNSRGTSVPLPAQESAVPGHTPAAKKRSDKHVEAVQKKPGRSQQSVDSGAFIETLHGRTH
jgi:serine/threonine protein kinase